MKILIVEDDATTRRILVHFLEPYGECQCAENGMEGISKFKQALHTGAPFDLVCLDIIMPETDGLQTLIEIRSAENMHGNFNYRKAKVIVITSLDDLRDVMASMTLMCQEYIKKPVNRDDLVNKIRSLGLL